MKKKFLIFFRTKKKYIFPIILALYFFIKALSQINDYGMNWDSPVHFARGQAFLRYFLTGKTNYDGAPSICIGKDGYVSRVDYKTGEVCDLSRKIRVSENESPLLDFNYFRHDIYGHPPTSDLLLAISNTIFFKELGWIEDMHAYHVYNIFTAFLLALVVGIWVSMTFGSFAGGISVLIVYLYPLMTGEQQFNVKDPPMAAFFLLSIFLFWLAVIGRNWKYMVLSAIAGGISFGTKFNFVFAPFILFPWLTIYVSSEIRNGMKQKKVRDIRAVVNFCKKHFPYKMAISLGLYPIIIFLIFYFSWPVLWSDPFKNIMLVIKFYQDIGGGTCQYIPLSIAWLLKCSDPIPLLYILTTIPLISIALFIFGLFASLKRFRFHHFVLILWLTFFFFIVGRVVLPFSKTYGGLRQIIEFIGPFAMIGGVGALYMRDIIIQQGRKFRSLKGDRRVLAISISVLIVCSFFPIFIKLSQLHPNENIYFNPLIGGVLGAYKRNFYGNGNTYGNAYYQAVEWLNKNAERNSSVVLLSGLNQNISRQSFRADVTHVAKVRTSYAQRGEYQVTTLEQGNPVLHTFRYLFASRFLRTLYEKDVDGVPIVRIWKNDKNHIKPGLDISSLHPVDSVRHDQSEEKEIDILLASLERLQRIEFRFSKPDCKDPFVGAKVFYGNDAESLESTSDEINDFTAEEIERYHADFVYLLAGDEAKRIAIIPPPNYMCNLSDVQIAVYAFDHLGSYETSE